MDNDDNINYLKDTHAGIGDSTGLEGFVKQIESNRRTK